MTNTFGINYTDKLLHILFNGETHKFDLTEGDLPDFWAGFESKDGRVWDVNFFQEDETCEPSVSVYPAVLVDGEYEINTSEEYSLDMVARTGTPKEYFEAWDASSSSILQEGDVIGNRFKVSKITPPIAEAVMIQKNRELKQTVAIIIAKIEACGIGAWNADLENTVEAVTCEDYYGNVESDKPTVKYNGWFEDLQRLKEIL
jgi:hypothetical protein